MTDTGTVSDPARLGARAARDAIRAGRLAPGELLEACLSRIAARDDTVRAWHFLDPALPRAAVSGLAAGVLEGLPVGVKDITATADMPTACGSPIYRGHVPGRDAACVAALRAAGGLVMGKTATTEFAAYTPTETRNPHDPAHTPGGSSSGSAAAVADFQVPLATGTQTAGSVIRPASFCGVVGLKPTFGTVDYAGTHGFAASLDTLGVFARSAGDAALFAGAMAGWEALTDPAPEAPRRVRIIRAPHWGQVSAESEALVETAARLFADHGVTVTDTPLPAAFEDLLAAQELIQLYEGRRALAWERHTHGDKLSEGLRGHFDRVAAVPFTEYRAARQAQALWQQRIDGMMAPGEVWLTAAAPGEAPEGLGATGDPVFSRVWTLLHVPCIALPMGRGPKGLPIGIQLVGPRWRDPDLIAAALWFEERRGA